MTACTQKGLCLPLSWSFRESYLWIRLEAEVTSKLCCGKYTSLAYLKCRCKKTWLWHNLFPYLGFQLSYIIFWCCENHRTVRTFSFYQRVSWKEYVSPLSTHPCSVGNYSVRCGAKRYFFPSNKNMKICGFLSIFKFS